MGAGCNHLPNPPPLRGRGLHRPCRLRNSAWRERGSSSHHLDRLARYEREPGAQALLASDPARSRLRSRLRGRPDPPAAARPRAGCRRSRPGSSWARSQRRSWAEGKRRRPRPPRSRARAAPACRRRRAGARRSRAARAATVGSSNSVAAGISTPKARRTLGDHLRGEQRVAAEVEEAVVAADPLVTPRTSRPDSRRSSSSSIAPRAARPPPPPWVRRSPPRRREDRFASASRSILPFGEERQGLHAPTKAVGTMRGGQPALQPRRAGPRGPERGRGADHVGDERAVAALSDRRAVAHFGVAEEHGLDLARLDAEAADLHLAVEAPEVFELAVARQRARSPVR